MEGLLGAGGFRARPILPAAVVVPATRARADLSPWAGFDHENSCFVKYRSGPLTACTILALR